MTEEQIKSLQSTGGDHLSATEKNILGNDMQRLWETVASLRENTGGRIDFVLDNAGFELYCDCVYGMSLWGSDISSRPDSLSSGFPHSKWTREGDSFPR